MPRARAVASRIQPAALTPASRASTARAARPEREVGSSGLTPVSPRVTPGCASRATASGRPSTRRPSRPG
ncbi:hypothetical protein ACFFX0_05845 [Citricoccus parietis]|uniref:Uncharacterized protein n=1 Tax=Citricoccus parietis TaxID=592307 RepID=A0ABV5FVP4_9MICC